MKDRLLPIDMIHISLDIEGEKIPVGRLLSESRQIYFEYDSALVARKLDISPLRLPLKAGAYETQRDPFDGLPGVFADSLPDGWGRLLLDRSLRAQKINPEQLTVLDRLAHVGARGMGALVYEPECREVKESAGALDLNVLATQANKILQGEASMILQELAELNGSSSGARPKVMVGINPDRTKLIHGVGDLDEGYEHWMVKFPNMQDGNDFGAIEYVYSLMAKEAGIGMSETHLFPAKHSPGYFATKRFDRRGRDRFHLHTVAGLLHDNFRAPSLDYEDLIRLTLHMTRDVTEVEKMYRLAVFNVLAHNRDDHTKNFSFLMDKEGRWKLSPAYDLVYSSGPGGEQSTMVVGEGRNPEKADLLKLAKISGIAPKKATKIIEQCMNALSGWKKHAKAFGVSSERTHEIERILSSKN